MEQKSSSFSNVTHYGGAEGERLLRTVKPDPRVGGQED